MRKLRAVFVLTSIVAFLAAPTLPAGADADPFACMGTSAPGPLLGDGATPGDAEPDATPLSYGCFTARLQDARDVDGYRIHATPVHVEVRILEATTCPHVTWFRGPPPSDATSRWMCEGDSHTVSWDGTHPMRLQLWHGPGAVVPAPTDYTVRVLPLG